MTTFDLALALIFIIAFGVLCFAFGDSPVQKRRR